MRYIKRGQIWHVRYKTADGERTMSTKQTSKKDAIQVAKESGLSEIEKAAQAGVMTDSAISVAVNGKKVTLRKAYTDWDTWMEATMAPRTRTNNAMYFNAFINSIAGTWSNTVTKITHSDVDKWVNNGGKKGTRRIKLAALRSFWKWAVSYGITSKNPAALTKVKLDGMCHAEKETTKRDRVINDLDYEKIINRETMSLQHGSEWRSACILARRTGLRMGDVLNIEASCFDWRAGTITVWTDKRDKRVNLEMHADIFDEFNPNEDPEFWDGIEGRVFTVLPMMYADESKRAYLSRLFSRHCRKLGITATFHDWRHTYATECRRLGQSMPHIASKLGHSSTDTTEVYVDKGKVLKFSDVLAQLKQQRVARAD